MPMRNKLVDIVKRYLGILLAFIVVAGIVIFSSYSILEKVVEESLEEIAKQGAQVVEKDIQRHLDILTIISKNKVIQDPDSTVEDKLAIVRDYEQVSPNMVIGISDAKGNLSTAYKKNLDVSGREYFQKALNGEKSVSGPMKSSIDGSLIVAFSIPVYREDKVRYVIVGYFPVEELNVLVDSITFLKSGYAYMLDSNGITIAHRNRSLVYEQTREVDNVKTDRTRKNLVELEAQMAAGKNGAGEYTYDGIRKYMGFSGIKGTNWSIAVTTPQNEVYGDIRSLWYLLISFIFAIGISLVLVNRYLHFLRSRVERHRLNTQKAVDTARIMIIGMDGRNTVTEVNRFAEDLLGTCKEDILGKNISAFLDAGNREKLEAVLEENRRGILNSNYELTLLASGNKPIHILYNISHSTMENGKGDVEIMGIDITEKINSEKVRQEKNDELMRLNKELSLSQKRLEYMAYHDTLTGLPNRQLLNIEVERHMKESREKGTKFTVLFVDTDNFKNANDVMGHAAGDTILKEIAGRLTEKVLDKGNSIFRLGGDEFIVLREHIRELSEVKLLAQKVLDAFEPSFFCGSENIRITCSVGISIFPDDSSTLDEMFANADIAMYKAKDGGRNRYVFFNSLLQQSMAENIP